MARSQSSFEDIAGVSEDGNQILRNIFVGLSLCRNGIWLPKITLNDLVYTSLFDLETRLMRWAQSQQSARNNGFEVWHAKYLAGCCFLVGSKISVCRLTSSIPTTTRTTRCAVSMINEVIKNVFDVWGTAAFSLLPALAMKKYMLASVARHCEQKRLVTIPEVSRIVAQQFYSPGPPGYRFNPIILFSRLTGEDESRIASWLGLPHVPGMAGCSWQDLGLLPVQTYVDTVATETLCDFERGSALHEPLEIPSLPTFDTDIFKDVSNTPTTYALASDSHSHNSTIGSMQPIDTSQNDVVPSQVRFPSQMIGRPSFGLPWPVPPHRKALDTEEEPTHSEITPNEQNMDLRHPPILTDLRQSYQINGRPWAPYTAGGSGTTEAKGTRKTLGRQKTSESLSRYTNEYPSHGYSDPGLDRQYGALS